MAVSANDIEYDISDLLIMQKRYKKVESERKINRVERINTKNKKPARR